MTDQAVNPHSDVHTSTDDDDPSLHERMALTPAMELVRGALGVIDANADGVRIDAASKGDPMTDALEEARMLHMLAQIARRLSDHDPLSGLANVLEEAGYARYAAAAAMPVDGPYQACKLAQAALDVATGRFEEAEDLTEERPALGDLLGSLHGYLARPPTPQASFEGRAGDGSP